MASLEDMTKLRELINEPDDTNGWSDERLAALLDEPLTLNAAASRVWVLKAGQFATLVDVSESGSSRKLGDLYKNAIAMGQHFEALEASTSPVVGDRPVVQRIRRSFT